MTTDDVSLVSHGACTDLYCIETEMFDVTGYGAVYVLDAERPAIVETGIGTKHERILGALDTIGIDREAVAWIALTHVHLDHAGGAGFLADACPNATVAVHEIGAPHVIDPSRLVEGTKRAVGDQWQFYTDPRPVSKDRIRPVDDGDSIDLGDHELRVHHAPGHAPHQVVYHDPSNEAVFTGDAAGIWIPERETIYQTSPPPNFDLEQAIADLDIFRSIEPTTLLFTHFGPATYTDELLDAYADTLTRWVQRITDKREELEDDEAVISHFVETNTAGDVWGETKARFETAVNVNGVLVYLDRTTG